MVSAIGHIAMRGPVFRVVGNPKVAGSMCERQLQHKSINDGSQTSLGGNGN
jgi:hypothetical protein